MLILAHKSKNGITSDIKKDECRSISRHKIAEKRGQEVFNLKKFRGIKLRKGEQQNDSVRDMIELWVNDNHEINGAPLGFNLGH